MSKSSMWFRIVFGMIGLVFLCGCMAAEVQPKTTTVNNREESPSELASETISFEENREIIQTILDESRPENALMLPSFTGNISDVRITVKPRSFYLPDSYPSASHFNSREFLQIYYGYCLDGVWYDIPCENYELIGIFDNQNCSGFDAAGGSHVVKIGDYLLICVKMGASLNDEAHCQITDTLGSAVTEPFTDYYTVSAFFDSDPGYGYFKEAYDSFMGDQEQNYAAQDNFGKYYYVVLDYDKLPGDYELYANFYNSTVSTETLTYNEINSLVG